MNKGIAVILTLFLSLQLFAQDSQYSQFYAAPLYVNPAFTGLTEQHRIVANVRNQWPGLPNDFLSTSFSYDRWIDELNSGAGIIANGDLQGNGRLWHMEIAPTYAYQAIIAEKVVVRPGLKFGFNQIGINKNRLVFNDQLESGQESTVEDLLLPTKFYLDFSAGFLALYDKYWAGMSINHLNQPDQSLVDNGEASPLPRKYSVHCGAKIPLEDPGNAKLSGRDLTFALHYKAQNKFDQLDIGGYYNMNPVVMGLWYRGLPFKSNRNDAWNADALTFLFGLRKEGEYAVGFSYDVTVSKLSIVNSIGSFELSYIKEWTHKKKKRRKQFIIPCAKF